MTIETDIGQLNDTLNNVQNEIIALRNGMEGSQGTEQALIDSIAVIRRMLMELEQAAQDLEFRQKTLTEKLGPDGAIDQALQDAHTKLVEGGELAEALAAVALEIARVENDEPKLAEPTADDNARLEAIKTLIDDYDNKTDTFVDAAHDEAKQATDTMLTRRSEVDAARSALDAWERGLLGMGAEITRLKAVFKSACVAAGEALKQGGVPLASVHYHDAGRALDLMRSNLATTPTDPIGTDTENALDKAKTAWTSGKDQLAGAYDTLTDAATANEKARLTLAEKQAEQDGRAARRLADLVDEIESQPENGDGNGDGNGGGNGNGDVDNGDNGDNGDGDVDDG